MRYVQIFELKQYCVLDFCRVFRIARKRDDVFLPREFRDLGGEDQVLRALRELTKEGKLIRLGYGVYGRAITSQISGESILYSGLRGMAHGGGSSPRKG
jgi:hypothetical protein